MSSSPQKPPLFSLDMLRAIAGFLGPVLLALGDMLLQRWLREETKT